MFKDTASRGTTLQDVMATSLSTTTPDAKKDELASIFKEVRLPVFHFDGCRFGWLAITASLRTAKSAGGVLKASLLTAALLQVSGVPVVKSKSDMTLIGVISKKDLSKPGTYVKDVMSTPPVAARPDNKVADAAALMLKHKVRCADC